MLGIVSGSGIALQDLLDSVTGERAFGDIAGLARGGVLGHEHRFVLGHCGALPIVIQSGRLHFYEGFDYESVVRPVDVMYEMGVKTILFTCATGGLAVGMEPGDLVAVERIRLWRYKGWSATPGMLFTDFVPPDCDFRGTYQWMHGPCYETRAEIGALHYLKAEVVGMSTAPEVMRCQELGIRAGVIACVTNSCCKPHVLTHDEVLSVAKRTSRRLSALIRSILPEIANT